MPGLIVDTVHQGYGYLEQSGYVGMAVPYVEKVRNTVPLADRAAKMAEERVPPLIKKVDELAEPTIEKMKPYVEPRIEQVKETVTPYVNKGVEKYEQIKDFTETKTTKVKETVTPYVNKGVETYGQIKDYTEAKQTQIKDFRDRQVTHVKDFTDAKATQIKNLTDPPVKKIKNVVEPKIAAGKIRFDAGIKKVAGCANLQDLKVETVMGKVASGLSQAEALLDKYLPVPIERQDSDSDASTESDSSCVKCVKSVHVIKNHLLCALMIKIRFVLSLPMLLKASYADGSMKEKVVSFYTDVKGTVVSKVEYAKAEAKTFMTKVEYAKAEAKTFMKEFMKDPKKASAPVVEYFKGKLELVKCKAETKKLELMTYFKGKLEYLKGQLKLVSEKFATLDVKLAPTVAKVAKNPQFIKGVKTTVAATEKIIGKEKTVAIVTKIESCIPSVWMAGPKLPAKTTLDSKRK